MKVRITKKTPDRYGSWINAYIGEIFAVTNIDDKLFRTIYDPKGILKDCCEIVDIDRSEIKVGDWIEVSDDAATWEQRKVMSITDGFYYDYITVNIITVNPNSCNHMSDFGCWKYIRFCDEPKEYRDSINSSFIQQLVDVLGAMRCPKHLLNIDPTETIDVDYYKSKLEKLQKEKEELKSKLQSVQKAESILTERYELMQKARKCYEENQKIYVPSDMFFMYDGIQDQSIKICDTFTLDYYESKNTWVKEQITTTRTNKEKELELVCISKEYMKDGNFYIIDMMSDKNYYRTVANDIDSYEMKIGDNFFYYCPDTNEVGSYSINELGKDYIVYEVRRVAK